ncbi:hypothetical protein O6H91_23G064100 [Diphasiastrum complanatum]|uniref:Uncharacterized protein n=1 Tax=Diphasiastrum complanatum TaxID=34168 RepID=A0ACC2ABH0_DIPCM|nr:hypothetical protein O6H91_23G064100 [Diphasiastrum complanatum]
MQYKRYRLNIWDVGGQKTLRSYWRNYYEQTDGLVWVVDSSDLRRLEDCKLELHGLLQEERLSGASLLIFANKQDLGSSLEPEDIAKEIKVVTMAATLADDNPLGHSLWLCKVNVDFSKSENGEIVMYTNIKQNIIMHLQESSF